MSTAALSTINNKPQKVPQRAYGTRLSNDKLPPTLPIVGLGCSSFSTFFWTPQEHQQYPAPLTVDTITKDHPRVQEWIETIRYAVLECGITLLDTAPWYGHGTSEVVIGLALQESAELRAACEDNRMTIQTKVGRYEADPSRQFDFSYDTTIQSIQRSLQRLECQSIDVLQLHDPEFSPTLDQLMNETIPAMIYAQEQGWCKALGMTGYPLEVQYQILQRSLEVFGTKNVWDQALTYGHFNLHNTRLTTQPLGKEHDDLLSFEAYCQRHKLGLLAAAPLSMGLLTPPNDNGKLTLADWHPAAPELKEACQRASLQCQEHGINIASLATLFALCNLQIACTIIGCKNLAEVQRAANVANRFHDVAIVEDVGVQSRTRDADDGSSNSNKDLAQAVMTTEEYQVLQQILDPNDGPFAQVWKKDLHHWDGIRDAQEFWKAVPSSTVVGECWHDRSLVRKGKPDRLSND